jgi:hypothetical protein
MAANKMANLRYVVGRRAVWLVVWCAGGIVGGVGGVVLILGGVYAVKRSSSSKVRPWPVAANCPPPPLSPDCVHPVHLFLCSPFRPFHYFPGPARAPLSLHARARPSVLYNPTPWCRPPSASSASPRTLSRVSPAAVRNSPPTPAARFDSVSTRAS